ncbi:PIG-X [Armillaria novae-zelandiae]|uniref:Protein PBN1 n=1 Tax=Armillaria novae-zelandiae TaxID=153914 RepID=A0AA39PIR2_9AGAR|nr:PIG-X [Armillaria novae-zelandiae]
MASLSSTIHPSYGFHPTVTTNFHGISMEPSCRLFLLLTLPPLVFVDPYELANYKDSYTFHHAGPSNLELPVSAIGPSNSHIFVNASHRAVKDGSLQIPLHLRYGEVSVDGFQAVDVSVPEGYVICEGRADFDAGSHIPEEFTAFFRQSSVSRLSPSLGLDSVFHIQAPVGRPEDASQVERGTAVTILLCFIYLAYTLYRTTLRLGDTNHAKSS